jgi:hypothetical protein
MRRYFEQRWSPFPPTPLESRFSCRAMGKDPLSVAQRLHCVNHLGVKLRVPARVLPDAE